MFTGRGGRFGSTPGLFVGMGFCLSEINVIVWKINKPSLNIVIKEIEEERERER